MGMVAPEQRIASAFVVFCGNYGDVQQQAVQRGVSRQRLYREAAWVWLQIEEARWQKENAQLRQRVRDLQEQNCQLRQDLSQAIVLPPDKQVEFACVGQALGVSLSNLKTLLEILMSGAAPSVATLGRWTQEAGQKSAALLEVLDECTRPGIRQVVADEIFVKRPTLMMVEPESLCWVTGHLIEHADGESWQKEFERLPHLEQVTRDAGSALSHGVMELNRQGQKQGRPAVADQLDHFHILREGGRGLGRAQRAAQRAWKALQKAESARAERQRHGQPLVGCGNRLRARRPKAIRALQIWEEQKKAWQKIKEALKPFTPDGQLNTRQRAEGILAQTLPQLPDETFGRTKRLLQRPQTLTYLDEMQRKLQALPLPAEVRQAAVRQEGFRRHPEALHGDHPQAAALRGICLVGAVILAKAGEVGRKAVQAVRAILRRSWRASSLGECVNSVVRMQQARHRKMSQGLIDLKRLYWNCHRFRTGRRRGRSPYELLGVPWPDGHRWWDVLQWSPEQLRDKLSALPMAA